MIEALALLLLGVTLLIIGRERRRRHRERQVANAKDHKVIRGDIRHLEWPEDGHDR